MTLYCLMAVVSDKDIRPRLPCFICKQSRQLGEVIPERDRCELQGVIALLAIGVMKTSFMSIALWNVR